MEEEKHFLLHQKFIEVAKQNSKKIAIFDQTLKRKFTYKETLIASLMLAKRFREVENSFVGILLPTSAACIFSMLGTLMAGKTPVMINYSTGAAQNSQYAQKKCSFQTIITSKKLLETIQCPFVEGMIFIEDLMEDISTTERAKAAFLSGLPKNLIYSKIGLGDIENTALILFTSGSESEPKAVELSHKNISSNVIGAQESFQLKSDDSILAILPLFHVFGQTTTVWLPFYSGLQITTYSNPLHAKTIVRIIREVKPALITATPAFFMSYLRASKKGDFSSVRLAIVGADKTPTWLREHYQEQHQVHLYDGYGTTETSPVISANTPLNHREGSVGKPFPDVRVKIVHIHTEEEVTSGQEGKILVKGDLVMKGYYGDFEQTNLRIHNGWYETGDIGKFDENGFLWHCGRLKRFVKIAGEMVSLVTIESHLEAFLPDDTECCVVDIPDPKRGAKIIVVLTKEINQQMITEQLSKHLPNIAIPKTFLTLPELPKASSGKMDFRKVAEIVQEKLKLG